MLDKGFARPRPQLSVPHCTRPLLSSSNFIGMLLKHLRPCCSKAPPPGDMLLVQLSASLPSLPRMPLLRYTACMTVASYSGWLAATAAACPSSQLMPQLLQMLTAGDKFSNACFCSLSLLCDSWERALMKPLQNKAVYG